MIKQQQPPPTTNLLGDNCPEVEGLPPLTEKFVIDCADAKDKGAGRLGAYLLSGRVAYTKETEIWNSETTETSVNQENGKC